MKKPKKRVRQKRTILIDLLKTDPDAAMRASRRNGGVTVVDARGVELFRLTMFTKPLRD